MKGALGWAIALGVLGAGAYVLYNRPAKRSSSSSSSSSTTSGTGTFVPRNPLKPAPTPTVDGIPEKYTPREGQEFA